MTTIYSQCQAPVKALSSAELLSRTAYKCRKCLNELALYVQLDIVISQETLELINMPTWALPFSSRQNLPLMVYPSEPVIILLIVFQFTRSTTERRLRRRAKWSLQSGPSWMLITESFLKFQTSTFSIHANRMGLGYITKDFCRSCRDEEKEENILHLLGTCAALCL